MVGDHFWSGAVASMNAGEVDVAERLRELQRRGHDPTLLDADDRRPGRALLLPWVGARRGVQADPARRPRAIVTSRSLGGSKRPPATGWRIAPSRSRTTRPRRSRWRVRPTCPRHAGAAGRGTSVPPDGGQAADLARRRAGGRVLRARAGADAGRPPGSLQDPPRGDRVPMAIRPARAWTTRSPRTRRRWTSRWRTTTGRRRRSRSAVCTSSSGSAATVRPRGRRWSAGSSSSRVGSPRRCSPSSTPLSPRTRCSRGRSEESLRWATRALELPHSDSIAVMTLHIRGNGRLELGDLGGMDDLWEALHQAEASGIGSRPGHVLLLPQRMGRRDRGTAPRSRDERCLHRDLRPARDPRSGHVGSGRIPVAALRRRPLGRPPRCARHPAAVGDRARRHHPRVDRAELPCPGPREPWPARRARRRP